MFLNEEEKKENKFLDESLSYEGTEDELLELFIESNETLHESTMKMIIAEHYFITEESDEEALNESLKSFFQDLYDRLVELVRKAANWFMSLIEKFNSSFQKYYNYYENHEEILKSYRGDLPDIEVYKWTEEVCGLSNLEKVVELVKGGHLEEHGNKMKLPAIWEMFSEEFDLGKQGTARDFKKALEKSVSQEKEGKLDKKDVELMHKVLDEVDELEEKYKKLHDAVTEAGNNAIEKAKEGLVEAQKGDDKESAEIKALKDEVANRRNLLNVSLRAITAVSSVQARAAKDMYKIAKAIVQANAVANESFEESTTGGILDQFMF
jgi:hypothetical protein